ncbi:MAG TPA: OmpA family protein [Myxococcota bacterium]|nr:OmpA family protein [Myxococcota bacterium]HRY94861.1 OmpA family protein [Myxococcota bacterium]HSA23651.1 OmpA family protein [Myxococcota bacterium]
MLRAVWVAMACLLAATPVARAGNVVDVRLTDKVVPGQQPSLSVDAQADLDSLVLTLKGDGGLALSERRARIPRQSSRSFPLPQVKPGKVRWRGSLEVKLADGTGGAMPLDFTTEIMASMELRVSAGDLDLERRSLLLRAARPVASVDWSVTSEEGLELGQGTFSPPAPAREVRLGWEQNPGTVLKIALLARDGEGFTESLDLFPWRWSVPHEELVFETGQADVLPTEAPKLDRSYKLIQEGLAKYGKLLPIKLYIAGHTDTVAAAETNDRLSEQRALSIARYLRAKGFRQPIFYQGFGERLLKVETPDETDELQNRRAEYLLAAEPPPMQGARGWKTLP